MTAWNVLSDIWKDICILHSEAHCPFVRCRSILPSQKCVRGAVEDLLRLKRWRASERQRQRERQREKERDRDREKDSA